MTAIEIPPLVRQRALHHGVAGRSWLDALPAVVEELSDRWALTLGDAFAGGTAGYVVAATNAGGRDCVLKVAMPMPCGSGASSSACRPGWRTSATSTALTVRCSSRSPAAASESGRDGVGPAGPRSRWVRFTVGSEGWCDAGAVGSEGGDDAVGESSDLDLGEVAPSVVVSAGEGAVADAGLTAL